ncbi:MAG: hypothetical protein EXX96DRAFT_200060 [Benjaminiella poitrasii]|nr:MAG: hypothetical protein EXX96DRAFT_200060 [Benjaminiella poitrasii]
MESSMSMDHNNISNNNNDWIYQQNERLLQEPVPFEEFKFSFNHDLFSTATINNDNLYHQQHQQHIFDPLFSSNQHDFMTNTTVLDENDQKAFSNFLDTFFMDEEREEKRRNSILKSLDEQKKLRKVDLVAQSVTTSSSINNQKIYLRKSDTLISTPPPHPIIMNNTNNSKKRHYEEEEDGQDQGGNQTTMTTTVIKSKRTRSHKELLTEEEKRANHIASEQKRRSIIRNGFNELTELVPTLKNINNSKSTILFKAVDFIRHLEKRNKSLREKIKSLELRAKVEGHSISHDKLTNHSNSNNTMHLPSIQSALSSSTTSQSSSPPLQQQQQQQRKLLLASPITTNTITNKQHSYHNNSSTLAANARNALLAHKSQQKQLLLLQEQLQLHQRLLAQKNTNKLPPIHNIGSQAKTNCSSDLLSVIDK